MTMTDDHVREALGAPLGPRRVTVSDWVVEETFKRANEATPDLATPKFEAARSRVLNVAWADARRLVETYGPGGAAAFRGELEAERVRAVARVDEAAKRVGFARAVGRLLVELREVGPTALVVAADLYRDVQDDERVRDRVVARAAVYLDYGAVFPGGRPTTLQILEQVPGAALDWEGSGDPQTGPTPLVAWLTDCVPEFHSDPDVDLFASSTGPDVDEAEAEQERAYRALSVVHLRRRVLDAYVSAVVRLGTPEPDAPGVEGEDDQAERRRQERAAQLRTNERFVTAAIAVLLHRKDGPYGDIKTVPAAYGWLKAEVEAVTPGAPLVFPNERRARESLPGGVENAKINGRAAVHSSTYEPYEHLLDPVGQKTG